jgi:glycerophosphoryl diester phosphodiesterase
MKDTPLTSQLLVAHRGYQAKYPENTQLSLLKAIEAGASYIELDVQFSADKLPIIYHDLSLQRVSGVKGYVNKLDREQLLSIPAYEPTRLGDKYYDETISPLEALTAILQDNPHVTAFVELKEESIKHCGREYLLQSVMAILDAVAKQTVVMSFDYQLALMARESNWPSIGLVLKNWEDIAGQEITAINPDYIFTNHLIIPPNSDLRQYELLAQTQLVAYEVGNKELAISLINQGVDMLETFNIAQLLRST